MDYSKFIFYSRKIRRPNSSLEHRFFPMDLERKLGFFVSGTHIGNFKNLLFTTGYNFFEK